MRVSNSAKSTPADLWASQSLPDWERALGGYENVVARQEVASLPELDRRVRDELPGVIASREPAYVTLDDFVLVTRWKMARGVWRARNLALVQGNDEEQVRETSREALAAVPDPRIPIAILTKLKGVGPATASAVAAAAAPQSYPFFDELAARQVPSLGPVKFTLPYYLAYAEALRVRAGQLGGEWTPALVERALWAHIGGKAGVTDVR